MKTKYILSILMFAALPFLFSSCSKTNLVDNWSDQNFSGPPLKKVLVIGIIKNSDKRKSFEKTFSKSLTTNNRSGIASYTYLPNLEHKIDKETILAAVEKSGADGVMIVTTHGTFQQERVTRGTVDYIPNTGLGYGMYGYYNMSHAFVYNPGYTVTDTLLMIDTKLFDVKTEKLIWSGKTETFNPTSAKEVINEFESLIIRKMESSGVI
ncbi:hypothetical protein MNBD_BACTEROID04-1363 [hydrothermal vent metagenome]|uniref:DUF4136 domain-containing protein n=1 Tax=hydrothermal vent metagenome TaxID=652676 RepID=A0A3B0UD16_9ZZZZ